MKVPTRRRGNVGADEGEDDVCKASMKVPAQRQRNLAETDKTSKGHYPHLYYQSAIELVIPPLPCHALLVDGVSVPAAKAGRHSSAPLPRVASE